MVSLSRLVGDAANTELVLVNAPFKDKQLALLVPGSCGNLIRFEVGYVANDWPVRPANTVGPYVLYFWMSIFFKN